MAIKDSKMNITVEDGIVKALSQLAEQEKKEVSDLVVELIVESLERREDIYFSAIAKKRDTKTAKRVKYADAWK